MSLRTQIQKERELKHQKIRKLYRELSANEENAKTAIEQKIMDKFDIGARSTVWRIVSQPNDAVGSGVNPNIQL